ncbi:MAG: MaoC family dehydratase N-terminal domain-containing protein [Candidatus Hydrogenedentes bacterium]|nr:MaoC family dehydratase N-terminal domain-containing protein [Candidatus Hydrogenedentota bacterium]
MTVQMHSKYVGIRTLPYKKIITDRHTMGYAAAVGDANPVYFDDEREDGIIAPPMLAVSLTWPLSSEIAKRWGTLDGFPVHAFRQQVHYTEWIEWRNPIRPGDEISISGEILAIAPHRGGTYFVVKYVATNQAGQELFTEVMGGLLRGVECPDAGAGTENLPKVPDLPLSADPLWSVTLPVDPLAAHVYDACAEIHFPIHTSKRFAHEVGLPNIILHGTATLSFAVRELINREADGDPTRLATLSCRFTRMIDPGTDMTIRLTGQRESDDAIEYAFDVLNHTGKRAISAGYARLTK